MCLETNENKISSKIKSKYHIWYPPTASDRSLKQKESKSSYNFWIFDIQNVTVRDDTTVYLHAQLWCSLFFAYIINDIFLSSVEHKRFTFNFLVTSILWDLFFCYQQKKINSVPRFGTTRGRVNDNEIIHHLSMKIDRIFIFGWTMPVKGIAHFEIHFWYVLAYLKGIREVSFFPQYFHFWYF